MRGGTIDVEGYKVRILKTIAEGGYGFVYLVEQEQTKKKYALKKSITQNEERFQIAINEVNFLKTNSGEANQFFVTYYASKIVEEGIQTKTVYLLMEVGLQGTLFDFMAEYNQKK